MSKRKKPLTDEEQFALKLREEDELLRLKRQYNIMVNDKQIFMAAAQNGKLHNQRLLRNLRKEKYNLDLDLAAAEGGKHKINHHLGQLQCLVRERSCLLAELDKVKRQSNEFDGQIKMVQKNLRKLKKQNQLSEVQDDDKLKNRKETLLKLENRLDLTVKQFCVILAENKKTRETIYSMLRQRQTFNTHCETLLNNLQSGKRAIADIIEQTSAAFDQREEYFEKWMMLKYKAQVKYEQHVEEMKNLTWDMQRQIDLSEFLALKGRKRLMIDLAKKEHEQQLQQKQELEEKLAKYKQIFNDIKTFSNEESVYKMEMQFLKGEEENYALFNYANALNAELENLSAATAEYYKKIDEQRELAEEREKKERATLEELNERLKQIQNETEDAQKYICKQRHDLKLIINGIEVVFKLMMTKECPLLELLGENTEITEHNVLLFLTVLETRLTDLIQQYLITYPEKCKIARNSSFHRNPMSPCPLCYLANAANEEEVKTILPINLHYFLECPNVQYGRNGLSEGDTVLK